MPAGIEHSRPARGNVGLCKNNVGEGYGQRTRQRPECRKTFLKLMPDNAVHRVQYEMEDCPRIIMNLRLS